MTCNWRLWIRGTKLPSAFNKEDGSWRNVILRRKKSPDSEID